jgi:hypothetical protein
MNQWSFVLAAYGVVVTATMLLLLVSWRAMRRAEADAAAVSASGRR